MTLPDAEKALYDIEQLRVELVRVDGLYQEASRALVDATAALAAERARAEKLEEALRGYTTKHGDDCSCIECRTAREALERP